VVTREPRVAAVVTNSPSRFAVLRLVVLVLVSIGTWSPRTVSGAAATTDDPGTKAAPIAVKDRTAKTRGPAAKTRGSAASYARHHEVKPEEIYLEEDPPAEPASPTPPASDNPEPPAEAHPAAAPGGPAAHVSLETSGYMDTDHVNVVSPSVAGGIADEVAGWSVNGHYLVDVVSAASVDIVSTASPHWTEVRHAGSVAGSFVVEPFTLGALGVISREPDYLSLTGGATLGFDLLEKNLSPYFAYSHEADSVGRHDLPHEYWKTKLVNNLQVGLTGVLGRATIGSVQWDGSFERGYLAKPYRYVPLFAPGQGASVPPGASIDLVNRLRLNLRPSEQLPSARDRYAVSGHLAHRYDGSTLRLDERLYVDSWGLLASTSELRFIIDLGRRLELWPHLRYHAQGAVSFWQRAYEAVPGPGGTLGVPVLRAGDRELSPLQTIVLGGGARVKLAEAPGTQWDLVLEVDVGRTHFSDALYIVERRMGYSTLAVEAQF
jgi:Protein of unknown function (DUF3570)